MALKQIKSVMGQGVCVIGNDIDTDRIIPARFMKCVTFEGLGEFAFYDVRFDENGNTKNHVLDQKEFANASILLSGSNFGCGSSREHAPQALFHFGIRAVIAESFAEIFFGNCTTLGIPCLTVTNEIAKSIANLIQENPQREIKINLEDKQIQIESHIFKCSIPEEARQSLIEGKWDSLGELLSNSNEVENKIKKIAYVNNYGA